MELITLITITTLLAYLLASFPSGVVISKVFYHQDIRNLGSKNTGVTNVGRVLGWKAGFTVLVLDLIKSVGGPLVAYFLLHSFEGGPSLFTISLAVYLAGFGTALGHSYPIFAGFRGGKAVSSLGGFLLTTNWFLSVIALTYFLGFIKITKYVSLGSITGAFLATLLSILYWVLPNFTLGMWPYIEAGPVYSLTLLGLTLLLIYRHKENIKRLLQGKENKVKW